MAKADTLTYRKALSTSLVGLTIQGVLAIMFAVYARYAGGDHTATSAAILVGLGTICWATLVLLYDQHRRERIEAMQAESLAAAESAASSAFEGTGDELLVATRRLQVVQKWVLPIVSLVFGALLIGFGVVRLGAARDMFDADSFVASPIPAWGLGVGLFAAFAGFVFARYVSGMAKQSAWSSIRAGAAQAVGASIVGLILAVVLFVKLAGGPDWPMRGLQVAIPVAMIALGAEVFLNFVLNLYRPRKPGEDPRPSFDSRILGFAAAPDKIAESVGEALSYQFGIDVTSSWFYQLLSKSIMLLVLFAGLIAWAMTSLVILQPDQRGLLLTFGKIDQPIWSMGEHTERDIGPGLHLKWPWPFSSVVIPEYEITEAGDTTTVRTTTGVQSVNLAGNPPDHGNEPILWGEQHTTFEVYNIVQPEPGTGVGSASAAGSSGSDLSLVAIEVPVQFVVSDVELYDQIAAPGQRRNLLGAIGRAAVSRFISHQTVNAVIATERTELATQLRDVIEEAWAPLNDGRGPGVEILFVGVSGAHPPRDVAPSFERVVQARQNREAKIEQATQKKVEILTTVSGRADLAEQIVALLDEIKTLEASGDSDRIAELEIEAQQLLAEAGGSAGQKIQLAGSGRWERHMAARAGLVRFAGEQLAYEAAPRLYETDRYLDTLAEVMRGARVFLTDPNVPLQTNLELQDQRAGADVFDPGSDGSTAYGQQ